MYYRGIYPVTKRSTCDDDIFVNRTILKQAESKALVAKSPAAFIRNKVLDFFQIKNLQHERKKIDHKMEVVNVNILILMCIGFISVDYIIMSYHI